MWTTCWLQGAFRMRQSHTPMRTRWQVCNGSRARPVSQRRVRSRLDAHQFFLSFKICWDHGIPSFGRLLGHTWTPRRFATAYCAAVPAAVCLKFIAFRASKLMWSQQMRRTSIKMHARVLNFRLRKQSPLQASTTGPDWNAHRCLISLLWRAWPQGQLLNSRLCDCLLSSLFLGSVT